MSFINRYQFGKITIDDKIYNSDVIIFPDTIIQNWRREKGHILDIKDLNDVIGYKPDVLIIGTGMFGLMHVNDTTITKIKEKGIKYITIQKTKEACEEYNQEKHIKKVAALHLSC
jgi:hypothetical protein